MVTPTAQLSFAADSQTYAYDVAWTQTPSSEAVADSITVTGVRYGTLADAVTNVPIGGRVQIVTPADLAASSTLQSARDQFTLIVKAAVASKNATPAGMWIFRVARTIRLNAGVLKIALAIYTRTYTIDGQGVVTLGVEQCAFATTDLTAAAGRDAVASTLSTAGATLDTILQGIVTAKGL